MRLFPGLFLSLIFSLAIFAQTGDQTFDAKIIAEAQAFEKELITVIRKGDRERLEQMIGDGFVFIHSTGPLENRDEYIKKSTGGNLTVQRTELENLDETWRVYGGNTVIHYARSVLRDKAANTENRLRNIAVYVKTKDKGWQWVSGQSTKLPVRPKAAAIDGKIYDDYAGVYQINAERTFTVTKENNALFGLITGRTKFELIPASETTFIFFNENNDAGFMEVTFANSENGKTPEAILRVNNQEIWRAKKIK